MGTQETGAQIDLLFDRPDNAIAICEIKYSENFFSIDKQYAQNLMNKIKVYQKQSNSRKQIFVAFISTNRLKQTIYSEDLVTGEVVLNDLFIA